MPSDPTAADPPATNRPASNRPSRDPAGFVASAMLPAIPLGLAIAAAGYWWLAMPVLVWAGLVLAGGNLVGFAGFALWYEGRRRRRQRAWLDRVWQEGSDDE